MLLLALAFAMVNPLTAPAGAAYFATSYVVRKHDLVYVCRQRFQVRGEARRSV